MCTGMNALLFRDRKKLSDFLSGQLDRTIVKEGGLWTHKWGNVLVVGQVGKKYKVVQMICKSLFVLSAHPWDQTLSVVSHIYNCCDY